MVQLPETMRAAVYRKPRVLEIVEDAPVPHARAGELLVQVSHCGICGSDIHFVLEGWGRPDTIEGHEWTGQVVEVGEGVEGWSVGDLAVGGASPKCGVCEYCLMQRPNLCVTRGKVGMEGDDGAFAQYHRKSAIGALHLPEGLTLRQGSLAEPMAVALHGITRAGGPKAGARWLITGGGPIGSFSVAALRSFGVEDIVVSEPSATRRELCEALGAKTVAPDELVAPSMPHETHEDGFDVALECSGRADAMVSALGQLRRTGTLVLVGAGIRPPTFDANRILLNELTITGAFTYDHDGFDRALELLASGKVPVDLLIDPVDVSLEGMFDAMEHLAAGDIAGKCIVVPNGDAFAGSVN
jgi:(R,R)-butanediol dehydrogenase/meso-butanediol dehydrogenase/diacetyl reductase